MSAAARNYAAALALQPTFPEASLNAGWVLAELERREEAVAAYTAGLSVQGRWATGVEAAARSNLGVLLRELGRPAEARAQWRNAVQVDPTFDAARTNLQEDEAKAEKSKKREAADSSSVVADRRFFSLITQGNDLYARGANAEAAERYRSAMPLWDGRADASAYVGLGAALHADRRLREAAHVLQAGARLRPLAPGLLPNLAIVRADLGQWRAAAKAWARAFRQSAPTDPATCAAAAGAMQRVNRTSEELSLLERAAALDPTNWQRHYSHAHAALRAAWSRLGCVAPSAPPPHGCAEGVALAEAALAALRPLHRQPISLRMRARDGAEPPWTRHHGRGLLGDAPPPRALSAIRRTQRARRVEAAAAGRQRGVIVYKLGPKESELANLRLSLTLLMRYHNRAFRYPIVIAHDDPIGDTVRTSLTELARGAALAFIRLSPALPSWLPPSSVPERVLGFPVAYRHMIRWKVGLLWEMAELQAYECASHTRHTGRRVRMPPRSNAAAARRRLECLPSETSPSLHPPPHPPAKRTAPPDAPTAIHPQSLSHARARLLSQIRVATGHRCILARPAQLRCLRADGGSQRHLWIRRCERGNRRGCAGSG